MHARHQPLDSASGSAKATIVQESAVSQVVCLVRALASSSHRRRMAWLALGVTLVIGFNAFGQIRLNAWHGTFYDALEQRDLNGFFEGLLVFVVIVCGLLALVVAQTWLHETIKIRLREWLSHDLLDQYLVPGRASRLPEAGEIGINPDQRMQEDAWHLAELSAALGIGLLHASLLLISFIGVLWVLSSQVTFSLGGSDFIVPGYMVWCALAYAFSGSWLTWLVGKPLIGLNAEVYAREADLRFALVRVNENADAVALHGGEGGERRLLNAPVERVIEVMRRLAGSLARLTWITSGYGWLAIVVPIIVASPGYFQGSMSFGGLMMVVGAFNQVQASLRWFVDNFRGIADWRATLLRVVVFRRALEQLQRREDVADVELAPHPDGRLRFDDLVLDLADGRAALDARHVEVWPGRHLLIAGEPASTMSALFRAIAGLAHCGSGRVLLPPADATMFVPQRPYLPLGTLRTAAAYPAEPEAVDDERLRAALERVGLGYLIAGLDRDERWDKTLSLDEQQRLTLARLVLHAPRWVFLDDTTAVMDEEHRDLLRSIFASELGGATVISIGRDPGFSDFYARTVRLQRLPKGAQPAPDDVPPTACAPAPKRAMAPAMVPAWGNGGD